MQAYCVEGSKLVKKDTGGVVAEAIVYVKGKAIEIKIEADCRTCTRLNNLTAKQCFHCEGNNYAYNSLHKYLLEL